jgi:hypothetical protein
MKINWHQNPLKTTVDLDESDKQKLLLCIQNEEYSNILCELDLCLAGKIKKEVEPTIEEIHNQISKWGEICNMKTDDEEVQYLVDALQYSHGGDCTCWPASCEKCHAEEALGIDTIKGLGKHPANKIMNAFGEKGDRTIDEAIESLEKPYEYEARHKSWEKYSREDYEKNFPRWQAEKDAAIVWLRKYKEEHGF